jgi:hypothetical protein
MYPELGVGAAVMTNGDGGPVLIDEVLRALAAEYGWPDYGPQQLPALTLDAKTVAGLTGRYQLRIGPGLAVRIEQDGDRLMFRTTQIPEQALLPKSDTTFVMSSLGWQVAFTRDASMARRRSPEPRPGGSFEEAGSSAVTVSSSAARIAVPKRALFNAVTTTVTVRSRV